MAVSTKKKIIRKFKKTKLNLYNLNGGTIKKTKEEFFKNFDTIKNFLKLEIDKLDLSSITFSKKNQTEPKNIKAFNENLNILNKVIKSKEGIETIFVNTSHINSLFDMIVDILKTKTEEFLETKTEINQDVKWLYDNLHEQDKFNVKEENYKTCISKYIELSINLYIFINNELKQMKETNMKAESNEKPDNTHHPTFENYDMFLKFYREFLKTKSNTSVYGIRDGFTNTTNEPNKLLENYNKFLELYIKFLFLKTKSNILNPKQNNPTAMEKKQELMNINLDSLNTFLELNEFIGDNRVSIGNIKIIIKNDELKNKVMTNDDIEIIVNTENLYVYKVKSKAAALKYGSGTKWCTASTSNNMYEEFQNELYILQPKDEFKDNNIFRVQKTDNKYQLHLDTNQLHNKNAGQVKINDIITLFNNDIQLIKFLKDICSKFNKKTNYNKYDKYKKSLDININRRITLCNEYNKNNKNNKKFSLDLNNSLNNLNYLTDVQTLTFGKDFNEPLGKSLNNLKNLQTLTFGDNFNRPLGDSLNNLKNLQILIFRDNFNRPLGDSLNNLTKLQTLIFGNNFDTPLGDSLNNLTNLQTLTFGIQFDTPLGDSLIKLKKLQTLNFGYFFNQPLDVSLNNLTNLQTLNFGYGYKQKLGDSLNGLTNLISINLPINHSDYDNIKKIIDTNKQSIKNRTNQWRTNNQTQIYKKGITNPLMVF